VRTRRLVAAGVVVVLAAALLGVAFAARGSDGGYALHRLVTDRADTQLVNAWGLAASPTGPWWTANEARSTSTLYSGTGRKQRLTVHVDGGPTGIVFNGGDGFLIHGGGHSDPARFIYACEDGKLRAWTPTVPTGWSRRAVVAVDDVGDAAIFRGLALAGSRLYATDFHNGKVDVFDSRWRLVQTPGAFVDSSISPWYAPFGIKVLAGHVFVTYAYRAPVNGNDAPSGGYVDEFTLDGRLVARLPRGGLNEPWGMTIAPPSFGRFGGDLLVGNFGDGTIDAFARDGRGWRSAGTLADAKGKPIAVSGLWSLAFGNGGYAGPRDTLFLTAGPHTWRGPTEQSVHGLLGRIEAE
jgi:uncharacterized protein (TIGR03118 family)